MSAVSDSAPSSAKTSIADLLANKNRDVDIVALVAFGLVVTLLAGVVANDCGLFASFASRVPLVESALSATVNQNLQNAGITRLSRGYNGVTGSANYLSVDVRGGESFELPVDAWRAGNKVAGSGRRYIIEPGAAISYKGAEPNANEQKEDFTSIIESDISKAVSAVNERRVAARSWQQPK